MFQDDHVVKILMKRCQEFKIIVKGQCTCSSWNFTFPQKFPQSIPWQPGDNSCAKIFWMNLCHCFSSVVCRNSLGGGNVTARLAGLRSAQLAPSHVCDVTSVSRSCVPRQVRFQYILSGETWIAIKSIPFHESVYLLVLPPIAMWIQSAVETLCELASPLA